MYAHFTDSELLNFVLTRGDMTPLESELVARLERMMYEVDASMVPTPFTQGDLFAQGGLALVRGED